MFALLSSIVTAHLQGSVSHKHWVVDLYELPEPQPNRLDHDREELLSVWWDINDPIIWELVHTISMDGLEHVLCSAREDERSHMQSPYQNGKNLLVDNVRPQTAKSTQNNLKEHGIEHIPYPPHSPNLATSDYRLFRSLSSFFARKSPHIGRKSRIVSTALLFKSPEFYAGGIHSLPEGWQYMIDRNGGYLVE